MYLLIGIAESVRIFFFGYPHLWEAVAIILPCIVYVFNEIRVHWGEIND